MKKIVRAKIPPVQSRPQGMKKCPYNCLTCPYVKESKTIKSTASIFQHDIGEQYVSQTEKTLSLRFGQHRGYVRNQTLGKATGHHFNLHGNSHSDMKVQVIEKVHTPDEMMRETRESHFILEMNTKHKSMNRKS